MPALNFGFRRDFSQEASFPVATEIGETACGASDPPQFPKNVYPLVELGFSRL